MGRRSVTFMEGQRLDKVSSCATRHMPVSLQMRTKQCCPIQDAWTDGESLAGLIQKAKIWPNGKRGALDARNKRGECAHCKTIQTTCTERILTWDADRSFPGAMPKSGKSWGGGSPVFPRETKDVVVDITASMGSSQVGRSWHLLELDKKKPRGRYDDFTVPNHVKTCWIKICMCISHAHMSIMVYPQKMDRVTADISIQLILSIQNHKHKNLPWPVRRHKIYYTQFPFVTKKGINVVEFRHRMLHHQRFPYFSPVIQRGNWKNKKHSSSHLVRWFSQRTKPPFGSRISSQPRLTTPEGIPNCWLLLVV